MSNSKFMLAIIACAWMVGANAMTMPTRQEFGAELKPIAFETGGMTLEQAVAMVRAKYGAKVMRANTVEEDGRVTHYIRLITPDRSRVWTVRVDAATGQEY